MVIINQFGIQSIIYKYIQKHKLFIYLIKQNMHPDYSSNIFGQSTPHSDIKFRLSDSTLNTSNSCSEETVSLQIMFKEFFKKSKDIKLNQVNQSIPEINSKLRLKLLDWIINVCWNYRIDEQGLFFTILLIDMAMKNIIVNKKELQALGLTCLYLSSKYTQRKKFKIKQILDLCKNIYTAQVITTFQQRILKILQFNLEIPTMFKYWQIYKFKLEDQQIQKSTYQILFLMELSLLMDKRLKSDKQIFLQIISFIKNKSHKTLFLKQLIEFYKNLEYKTIVNKYLSKFDVKTFIQSL